MKSTSSVTHYTKKDEHHIYMVYQVEKFILE